MNGPFELDARDAMHTAQIFCAARLASGEPINAETVKHYFGLAELLQRGGYELLQRVYAEREAAQLKRDGVKP